MKSILFLAICFLVSTNLSRGFQGPYAAAQGAQEFIRMIDGQQQKIETLRASFMQKKETTLVKGPLLSSGVVKFKRPDRIHWIYMKPEPMEVAIEGRKMQIYDPRKNQLTHYSLAPGKRITQAMEPMLQIFQRTFANLETIYTISYEGPEGGERLHFRLEPKEERTRKIFSRVELWIDKGNGAILRLAMTEANGDRLGLEFKDLQINPPLNPDDLEIKILPSTNKVDASGP